MVDVAFAAYRLCLVPPTSPLLGDDEQRIWIFSEVVEKMVYN